MIFTNQVAIIAGTREGIGYQIAAASKRRIKCPSHTALIDC
jgi:hypothetical protein